MAKETNVLGIIGQRVRVYRNLHRNCFSVQTYAKGRGWRVYAHVQGLHLKDVEFKVMETGRQKVIREKKKNVHAFVIGTVRDGWRWTQGGDVKSIVYNPYRYSTFVERCTGEAVHRANTAQLHTDKEGMFTSMYIDRIMEAHG